LQNDTVEDLFCNITNHFIEKDEIIWEKDIGLCGDVWTKRKTSETGKKQSTLYYLDTLHTSQAGICI